MTETIETFEIIDPFGDLDPEGVEVGASGVVPVVSPGQRYRRAETLEEALNISKSRARILHEIVYFEMAPEIEALGGGKGELLELIADYPDMTIQEKIYCTHQYAVDDVKAIFKLIPRMRPKLMKNRRK